MRRTKKGRIAVPVLLAALLLSAAALRNPSAPEAVAANAAITDWGLSFQAEGAPPAANASAQELAPYHALYMGDPAEKTIYLTFDAGFENGNTPAILDALKKHGVKATFFLVGNFLKTQPELVRRMAAEGHTVGNHTFTHPDMSKILDPAAFEEELRQNEALCKELTGTEMAKLYRPPQGKFCEENLRMASEMGYATVFWSLAYVDWYTDDQPTAQQAFDKLLPRVHPGAVILLHSTSSTNAAILDELLTKYEEAGYTFGDLAAYCSGLFGVPAESPSPQPLPFR